jgi:hypothetical protein
MSNSILERGNTVFGAEDTRASSQVGEWVNNDYTL